MAILKEFNLDNILSKAYREEPLELGEITYLLNLYQLQDAEKVFSVARQLRDRYFRQKIFLYGFVYFSTFCRNDCSFCLYRKSNKSLHRYRKSEREILETAYSLVDSGVHLLDLTMGEDPLFYQDDCRGFENIYKVVETIKKDTNVPLMISPGIVSEEVLTEFRRLGVEWYACYQETHNKNLYRYLRAGQAYETRMQQKIFARELGFLLEEGLLAGVGDTATDVAHSLEVMKYLEADQVRVMSFVPQKETPMHRWPTVPRLRELLIIAVMRLVFPGRLIPASLDVDGLMGLEQRLDAGANVVTSIIPPSAGLAGVSQSSLDIEEGNRTISRIIPVLEKNGLEPATTADYSRWVSNRQRRAATKEKGHQLCG